MFLFQFVKAPSAKSLPLEVAKGTPRPENPPPVLSLDSLNSEKFSECKTLQKIGARQSDPTYQFPSDETLTRRIVNTAYEKHHNECSAAKAPPSTAQNVEPKNYGTDLFSLSAFRRLFETPAFKDDKKK
jgi:hypothetical protein